MGMTAAIAITAVGVGMSANAARQGGKNQKKVHDFNAEINEIKALDATYRGRVTEQRHRASTKKLIGSQRAGFAASGVVVDDPDSTAANVFADTAYLSELDALTIRSNAAREAWGFRMGAEDERLRGRIAKSEGDQKAIGTIFSGVGGMLGGRYGF